MPLLQQPRHPYFDRYIRLSLCNGSYHNLQDDFTGACLSCIPEGTLRAMDAEGNTDGYEVQRGIHFAGGYGLKNQYPTGEQVYSFVFNCLNVQEIFPIAHPPYPGNLRG